MKKSDLTPEAAADARVDTLNALLSYLRDCRFDHSHLTTMHLALALEYAYTPNPSFWRGFDVAVLADAVTRHLPMWRTAMTTDRADRSSASLSGS